MKPINLSIQAFGPFAGKEEIDFTKLGNNPLFLINGPTGAGKSTILDAICFALYGQTTGAERDATQMRCDHSDMSLLTEVSLEFSLGKKKYRIRRVPKQERSKSKGDGNTIQVAEAQLWRLEDANIETLLVSKSVSDTNVLVKELIGLGVEQFRQVMVLPQGKFRELLMADSREREKIFSQLFETHIYKKIENRLKEKASTIAQAVKTHEDEVRGILKGAEVDSEAHLDDELIELSPQLDATKLIRDKAQANLKLVEKEKDQAVQLNKRLTELTRKKQDLAEKQASSESIISKQTRIDKASKAQAIYHIYNAQFTDAEKLQSISRKHETSKEALSNAKLLHHQTETHLEQARTSGQAIDTLKEEQTNLKRYEQELEELLKQQARLKIADKNAQTHQKDLDAKKQELERLTHECATKESLVSSFTDELAVLATTHHNLKDLEIKLQERQKLESVREKIQRTLVKIEKADDSVKVNINAFDKAQQHAIKTEMKWHGGQSAILAGELRDSQPCPVCGSQEHPAPATHGDNLEIITKQQVDDARKVEEKLRATAQSAKDSLATVNHELTLLKSQEVEHQTRLGDYTQVTVDRLKNELRAVQKDIDRLTQMQKEQESLKQQIKEIKDTYEQSNVIIANLQTQAQASDKTLIELQTKVQQIRSQIPETYRNISTLKQELEEKQNKIEYLTKNLREREAANKDSQSKVDQAFSTEKSFAEQREEQTKLAGASLVTWQEALDKSVFEKADDFLHAQLDDNKQNLIKREVEEYYTAVKSLEAVIKQLETELDNKQKADLVKLEEKLNTHNQLATDADNSWRKIEARTGYLTTVKEKLQKARKANELLNQQYAIYGTLNDVANGATGNKISLQRFVLSVLLDDVLIQASHRLHIMSKGRYRLIRKEDRAKGNKASGLELEVDDGDTGKSRSVATLSGGESFMAALSLALGLSDVVQSYAGGIKLDTLFIDEGFGSLDTDSLDAAIRVLMDLQASGRMIGIISHVSELKEQMAKRLDVLLGKTGSTISTIAA